MKTYKLMTSLLAGAVLFTSGSLSAASTNPVGYVTTTLSQGSHLIATPLLRPLITAGTVTSVNTENSTEITIPAPPALEDTNPLFFVPTSGTGAGVWRTIVAADGTSVTLESAISGLAAEDTFEIREHFTVGDLSDAAVAASNTLSTGDILTTYDKNGDKTTYSFNLGSGGWFQGGFTPVNESIIFPNEGVVLALSSSTDFTFVGDVSTIETKIDLNTSTFFILSNNDPSAKEGAGSIGAALGQLGTGSIVTVYSTDGSLTKTTTYSNNNGSWFTDGSFTPVEINIAAPAAIVVSSANAVTVTIPPAY